MHFCLQLFCRFGKWKSVRDLFKFDDIQQLAIGHMCFSRWLWVGDLQPISGFKESENDINVRRVPVFRDDLHFDKFLAPNLCILNAFQLGEKLDLCASWGGSK